METTPNDVSHDRKLEIIRLVENWHLPINDTLEKLGVSSQTLYCWCDLYQRFGEAGLDDRRSGHGRGRNHMPDEVRGELIDLARSSPSSVRANSP